MKTAVAAAVLITAALFTAAPGPSLSVQESEDLTPEDARVEAWWLVSAFRFKEAKDLLSGLEETDEAELELIDGLEEFSESLIQLLVEKGKSVTFKLKSGEAVRGKPLEFTADDTVRLHNDKIVELQQVSWESIAILSKSAAKRKGEEAETMCAAAYLLGGVGGKAKGSLRKAGGPLAAPVEKLAEDWDGMEREFTARSLAGIALGGDAESFMPSVEKLRDEFKDTGVYARFKEGLRARAADLLREGGEIGSNLNAIEDSDLGGGRRRLIYGFVSAEEVKDWEPLSFEEATADIHFSMRSHMLNYCNHVTEEAGLEPMDVELKPEMKEGVFTFPPGSAIRHRLRFKGDFTVSCEVAMGYEGYSLPFAVVHGGSDHYLFSFFWGIYARDPKGSIKETDAEKKDSYPISRPTTELRIAVERTRKGTEASLIYEGEERGKVDAEGITEGWLILGAIGPRPVNMTRVIIDGQVVPESIEKLAEGRIAAEARRLVP